MLRLSAALFAVRLRLERGASRLRRSRCYSLNKSGSARADCARAQAEAAALRRRQRFCAPEVAAICVWQLDAARLCMLHCASGPSSCRSRDPRHGGLRIGRGSQCVTEMCGEALGMLRAFILPLRGELRERLQAGLLLAF